MIVSWELSEPLEATPVMKCFERTIEEHGVPVVTSSDQRSTYTADIYVNCSAKHSICQSMDGKARWVDNVVMERWC
jgi:putative transposase